MSTNKDAGQESKEIAIREHAMQKFVTERNVFSETRWMEPVGVYGEIISEFYRQNDPQHAVAYLQGELGKSGVEEKIARNASRHFRELALISVTNAYSAFPERVVIFGGKRISGFARDLKIDLPKLSEQDTGNEVHHYLGIELVQDQNKTRIGRWFVVVPDLSEDSRGIVRKVNEARRQDAAMFQKSYVEGGGLVCVLPKSTLSEDDETFVSGEGVALHLLEFSQKTIEQLLTQFADGTAALPQRRQVQIVPQTPSDLSGESSREEIQRPTSGAGAEQADNLEPILELWEDQLLRAVQSAGSGRPAREGWGVGKKRRRGRSRSDG